MIMVLFCLAISLRKKYRSITHRFLDLSPFSRLISVFSTYLSHLFKYIFNTTSECGNEATSNLETESAQTDCRRQINGRIYST